GCHAVPDSQIFGIPCALGHSAQSWCNCAYCCRYRTLTPAWKRPSRRSRRSRDFSSLELSKRLRSPFGSASAVEVESAVTAQGTALSPRVAITSVGLGRIQRGYERYISGIFGAFQDRFDIALYKGAGSQGSGEKVPTLLGPITTAARLLPLGLAAGGAEYKTYKHDCLAFCLALLPDLLRSRIHVVHVI